MVVRVKHESWIEDAAFLSHDNGATCSIGDDTDEYEVVARE